MHATGESARVETSRKRSLSMPSLSDFPLHQGSDLAADSTSSFGNKSGKEIHRNNHR